MKKVLLHLAVRPPGFEKTFHPGSIIELDDEIADKYCDAKYASLIETSIDIKESSPDA
jgi:hypothetical protein